jgi:tetratricopeptide (TPR) repeat protein
MKRIKSFYTVPFFITVVVFCSCLLGQKVFDMNAQIQYQGGVVTDTDFGSFLAAQHALYINDFDNASKMISEVKADNKDIKQIKNLTEFFGGKMPQNAESFKDSKDVVERLIYDAFLLQKDDWKSVYKRHNKDNSMLSAPIRIFSGSKTKNPKDTAKFIDSIKADANWKSFVRGQIAVLNNDIDTAAKEFAKVHPDFMNVNDYLYLMSFYKHNGMFEDMEILRDDFLAKVGGMYMLNYTDIPDWSNYEGYKNNLVFSLVQTVSHTQIMLYTDLSLMFLRFAEIISDGTDMDAINYYLGQYYYYNSGDYETSFNKIQKSSPLYLFGQLKIAEKTGDFKAIEKIARKNPWFVPAVQIVGRESIKNGDKSRALSVLNRALKQKNLPVDGQIYFLKQRAYVYVMFGDTNKAQKDLNTIKDLTDKIMPDALLLQARVWTLQNKNLDDAYRYVMALIKLNTSDVSAWDALSVIIDKREGVENALEILERVGEVTPTSSVYEHLGDFYKKQGDIERAKKAYNHALDLADDGLIVVPFVQKKIRKLK